MVNKSDIVFTLRERLSKKLGRKITYELAEEAVNELLSIITEEVKNGEEVHIRGFGKFYAKKVAPRVARNLRTGEEIRLPSRIVFAFKPSSNLKVLEG